MYCTSGDVRCQCLTLLCLFPFPFPFIVLFHISETLTDGYILLFPTPSLPTVYSDSWGEIHVLH